MKRWADTGRKEAEEWKVGDRVMLSTKDLVFKERLVWKLVDWYITINKVISINVVKLKLPMLMRIHPVMSISWIVWYRDQVGEQKKEVKLIKVEEVKEWKVEKILNKRKVRGVVKYLVQWKGSTAEYDSWEKEEDLENTKEVVAKFERRINAKVKK